MKEKSSQSVSTQTEEEDGDIHHNNSNNNNNNSNNNNSNNNSSSNDINDHVSRPVVQNAQSRVAPCASESSSQQSVQRRKGYKELKEEGRKKLQRQTRNELQAALPLLKEHRRTLLLDELGRPKQLKDIFIMALLRKTQEKRKAITEAIKIYLLLDFPRNEI